MNKNTIVKREVFVGKVPLTQESSGKRSREEFLDWSPTFSLSGIMQGRGES